MTRFGTVLVANRGEIALRVLRAAAGAGLQTVAVYSDADRDAPHVRAADTAVRLGPSPAAESYLSTAALLRAAQQSGADAVHPGYGFLSERSEFALAATEAGLVFIGPSPDVMAAMGRKDKARAIAIAAGVPVVPAADAGSKADLDSVADQVGFPLLVKAAAGGGGKGMRIVHRRDEFPAAVAAARREAAAAFGDGTVIFERYVEHGRHIEVQVIGDEQGSVLHLFERDCSVQRRHQKVIEEAPAATISAQVRDTVTSAAVSLARSVGYVNAGTVEFLVDGDQAFFLEMNTRLQVEHPVTELVTGLDLVQLQFAVAQGEPLPLTQDDIRADGHAIEARVYAEDPSAGFLPQAGLARAVHWPAQVRVDAALESGQRVSTYYDPMLGKIIAAGATREMARRALVQALDDSAIVGLTTNLGFLRELAASAAFRDTTIDTSWLDAHPDVFHRDTPPAAWWLAAWSLAQPQPAAAPERPPAASSADSWSPFAVSDGWRVSGPPAAVPIVIFDASDPANRRLFHVDSAQNTIDGPDGAVAVRAAASDDGWLRLEIDGELHSGLVVVNRHGVEVAYHGQTYGFERPDAFGPSGRTAVSDGAVSAPMPGTVLSVDTVVGARVEPGAVLGVLEAMKMEHVLTAPFEGTVTEVSVATGDSVELGTPLFVIEREDVQ